MHVGYTWESFLDYLKPYDYTDNHSAIWAGMRAAIIMPMWLLGPGCGSVLQLASHNRFRHDSEKTTYWIAFTFLIMTQMAALCSHIAFDHFEGKTFWSNFDFRSGIINSVQFKFFMSKVCL